MHDDGAGAQDPAGGTPCAPCGLQARIRECERSDMCSLGTEQLRPFVGDIATSKWIE